jgi:CitMHS family citrate-Mg2+:H+ or citrate-Ca2+:H+ symporter
MFDIIVNRITKLTKNNIYVVLICTVLIAMIGHLDGAYNTTYLITIPTLLPLYKKLHIDSRILMFLTVMGATVMCVAPWGAGIVQLTPFAEVEASVLSQRLIPFAVVAFVLALASALMFGISVSKQNKGLALSADAANVAEAEKELDFSDKPYARPKMFAVNFLIFVVSILCLFVVKIQTYILFMIFTSLTLVVNYHDVKDQNALIRKYSATMLAPALLFMSIGVMVGIMKGTGMVEAVIDVVLNAIPQSMARYTHVIFGLLLVPIYLVLPYQVMLPIYPILTGIGTSLGISPASIMMVFALQYGTACSPLVAATNLGAELAEVNVIDHMKFSAPRCWLCSAILILVMVVSGAVFM